MMTATWRALLLTMLCAFAGLAQTYIIKEVTNPVLSGGKLQIGITFNKTVAVGDQSTVSAKANWIIFKYRKGNADPISVPIDAAQFAGDDTVVIFITPVAGEDVTRWVAVLKAFNFPSGFTAAPAQSGDTEGPFSAAGSRKEASIYLSGALAAAERSKPQYAIDSDIEVYKDLGSAGALGLEGSVIANQGPEVDPDSIRAFATYRKFVPIRRSTLSDQGENVTRRENTGAGIVFDFAGIGGEFNRGASSAQRRLEKPQVSNLMFASPQAILVLPRWAATQKLALEPELLGGVELGRRLETLPDHVSESRITRLVFGSNVYFYTLSEATGRKFMMTGQYRVRLPRTNEPYSFRDRADAFRLAFDQRTRHYVSVDTEYLFTPGLALSVKYKWGSLPPLFPLITHQVSLGIAVLIRQNGNY